MLGKLSNAETEQVIRQNHVCRLGCHAEGKTYVVPVSYVYDNGCMYVHTDEGMKLRMMRTNSNVCVEIDQIDTFSNWQSVIGWGNFEQIDDPEERQKALTLLYEHPLPYLSSKRIAEMPGWPFYGDDKRKFPGVVLRIRLAEKTGRFGKTESGGLLA